MEEKHCVLPPLEFGAEVAIRPAAISMGWLKTLNS
jgi:hypothetical protein